MTLDLSLPWVSPVLPARRRRRDRHGRGLRGSLLDRRLPAARTRRERFDDLVVELAREIGERWPQVGAIEFAVEDSPPSGPSPWEATGVPLGRYFAADRRTKLADRIVIYRRPCEVRAAEGHEREDLVYAVLVEHIAQALGRSPEEIDGN